MHLLTVCTFILIRLGLVVAPPASTHHNSTTTTTTPLLAVTPEPKAIYLIAATEPPSTANTTLQQITDSDTEHNLPKPPESPPGLVYSPNLIVESCQTFQSCNQCINSANGCGYCLAESRCIGEKQLCPESGPPTLTNTYCQDKIPWWEKATTFGFITVGVFSCGILVLSISCCTQPDDVDT